MTDDQLNNAFRGTPLTVAILLFLGYGFMLWNASWAWIGIFTVGIAVTASGPLLMSWTMKHPKMPIALMFLLTAASALIGTAGSIVVLVSVVKYLPA